MDSVRRKQYMPRIIDKAVERYLETFGAVCVEGPKWCGKTWTSSYHCNSEYLVGDPSNSFQNRTLAQLSPAVVLEGKTPRLIDEWQEVPSIWDAVRFKVDERGEKSQFILTGSSTPNRKGVLHSGAGRIGKLRMRTMSLYESGDSSGVVSLKDLCYGELRQELTGEVKLQDLIRYTVRGGWPGNLSTAEKNVQILPLSYVDAIIEDDMERIGEGRLNQRKMRLLLRSLARNESTPASAAKLINDMKEFEDDSIDRNTLNRYLDILSRMFLIDNQPPFTNNIRSSARIKQAEKRHLCDPALSCALIGATPERLLHDLNTFGFMFEALVERDLRIYAESFGAKMFHYQDYKNREIDAVIELEDGRWCAFEIKLGAHQIEEAANGLVRMQKEFEDDMNAVPPSVMCVICGMSNAAYRRPDGVFVVPITALRN